MKKILCATLLLMLGLTGALSAVTPEIDGGASINALALLGGVLLLVKTRRKN